MWWTRFNRSTPLNLGHFIILKPNSISPQLKEFVRFNTNSKQRWLQRQRGDQFTREAKLQNLRSRAAFKLMEIDDKYCIFQPSKPQYILDLGFAPGSWSQVARARSDPRSIILGVDILPCHHPIAGVFAMQANILSKKTQELIRKFFLQQRNERDGVDLDIIGSYPVDVVLSDMYVI